MKRFLIYIIIILSTWTINIQSVYSQILQATLSHLSTDNGMPSNSISDIKQDALGYIWISTWNGLARYDGFNFYNYETGSSSKIPLLHNRIIDLTIDHRQNIWLRMYDGHIFMLNRKADRIINPFEGIDNGKNIMTEHPLMVAQDGTVTAIINGQRIVQMKDGGQKVNIKITKVLKAITCMVMDNKGNTWLGCEDGKLLEWEKQKSFKEIINLGSCINRLFYKNEQIWIGMKDGRIVKMSSNRLKENISTITKEESEITSLFIDSENQLWFSTTLPGVTKINLNRHQRKNYSQQILSPWEESTGAVVKEINGRIWVHLNHGGFGYYNKENDKIEYFYNDPNSLWNLSNTVNSFCGTNDGVIWESTNRRGLEKLIIMKRTIKRTLPFGNTTKYHANDIRSMFYNNKDKTLIIGSKSGTMKVIKDNRTYIINNDCEGKNFGRIYNISNDSKGRYWICTKGKGLYMIPSNQALLQNKQQIHLTKNPNNKWSLNSDNLYCTVEDKDGNIWIATYDGGVNIIPKQKDNNNPKVYNQNNVLKHYPSQRFQKVRTLTVDKDGQVWVGTTDGLLIMSLKNGVIRTEIVADPIDYADGLRSYDIVCLATDNKGTVWIGTNGGGLSHCLGRKSDGKWYFQTYDTHDGLPSEEVRSITFDHQGLVWFGTDHTLCSFDPNKRIFSTFGMEDGVDDTSCSEAAALPLPNGCILFGTINGYYTLDRNKLKGAKTTNLKLRFTDFYLNDQLISPRTNNTYNYYVPDSNSVVLPTHGSIFAFRFASLNYSLQQRVHYQYKLEGYDADWHNADKTRLVSYSGVPTGNYILKVRAFLLEAPEQYDICTMNIKVPPYYLLSTQAIWIYLIIILLIVLLLFYMRQQQLARRENMRVLKVGPQEIAFSHEEDYNFVKQQLDWLESHYMESTLKTDDLVSPTGLSRTSYYHELKQLTGLSPKELILNFRLKKAQMYLEKSDSTVAEIAYKTGFNDPVYFSRIFKQKTGLTPTLFREMNRNEKEIIMSKSTTNQDDIITE